MQINAVKAAWQWSNACDRHVADSDGHGQCSPTCIWEGSYTTNSFAYCYLISDITWLTVVQVRFPALPQDPELSVLVWKLGLF